MVGLIRDTCPAFKRDQRIRPKTIIISVFRLPGVAMAKTGLCAQATAGVAGQARVRKTNPLARIA
jgi:hypothetical protein